MVVVLLISCVRLFATPWTAALQASLSLTISWSLPKFISIELMMPSHHLILCYLLLLCLQSLPAFSVSTASIRWPKYWSFSISPSNEYSGLIFLRIDWFDLHEVQGTLKNLFQHNSKALIIQSSASFIVQFSHLYMTTEKTTDLTTLNLSTT